MRIKNKIIILVTFLVLLSINCLAMPIPTPILGKVQGFNPDDMKIIVTVYLVNSTIIIDSSKATTNNDMYIYPATTDSLDVIDISAALVNNNNNNEVIDMAWSYNVHAGNEVIIDLTIPQESTSESIPYSSDTGGSNPDIRSVDLMDMIKKDNIIISENLHDSMPPLLKDNREVIPSLKKFEEDFYKKDKRITNINNIDVESPAMQETLNDDKNFSSGFIIYTLILLMIGIISLLVLIVRKERKFKD